MKGRRRVAVRPPTPERLGEAALAYLSRYAASEAGLRRVLVNKIRRAAMVDKAFAEDTVAIAALHEVIEQIIEKHKRLGVINDAAFAAMKVNSLRRSGQSAKMIALKLGHKGVEGSLVAQALAGHEEEEGSGDAEIKAARLFAKRRRLGPYRAAALPEEPLLRAKLLAKEQAILARAGFGFDIVRQVLEA